MLAGLPESPAETSSKSNTLALTQGSQRSRLIGVLDRHPGWRRRRPGPADAVARGDQRFGDGRRIERAQAAKAAQAAEPAQAAKASQATEAAQAPSHQGRPAHQASKSARASEDRLHQT